MTAQDAAASGPLPASDLAALASLARGNAWTRAALCTLARRGVLLRQTEPERAAALLDALAPWPWYKAGQFVFDLFEWEDFMVDGDPPPILPTVLDPTALSRLTHLLTRLRGLVDGAAADPASALAEAMAFTHPPASSAAAATDLPALEPGFHLYRDVVLGALTSAGSALTTPPAGEAAAHG